MQLLCMCVIILVNSGATVNISQILQSAYVGNRVFCLWHAHLQTAQWQHCNILDTYCMHPSAHVYNSKEVPILSPAREICI